MALLVAALMSASLSASAQGRKGEFVKCRKGEVRQEIMFRKCNCPKCMKFRKMEMMRARAMRDARFDRRFDRRFDARFDKKFDQRFDRRFDKRGRQGKRR